MNHEVNKIVQELYSCLPNDRNKFNSIMENLKEKFLLSPILDLKYYINSFVGFIIYLKIKKNILF